MSKRYRQGSDVEGDALAYQRKMRCTRAVADYDGHASPSVPGWHQAQTAAYSSSLPSPQQWQDDFDFPDFDAAIALSFDEQGDADCTPLESGSRPRELPRTLDERFVPGLLTFVGGLTMSRPLHERATDAQSSASAHRDVSFDGISIEPPPLEMSRRSVSSQHSSSPPRPSLDGTVRIVPNIGLAAPPPAPLVPGVSPGWHVESHGRQAMELHEGVRFRDDDGWTPLDAFPARTQQGRLAVVSARVQHRAPPVVSYRPTTGLMNISTAATATTPASLGPVSQEVFAKASSSRAEAAQPHQRRQPSPVSLPPISTIHLRPIAGDDFSPLSPLPGLGSLLQTPPRGPELRRPFAQSPKFQGVFQSSTQAMPPHVWFQNGAPIRGPHAPYANNAISHQQKQQQRLSPTIEKSVKTDAASPWSRYTLQDLEVLETLGTGTFGRVLLVRLKDKAVTDASGYFALKVLAKSEVVQLKQVEHTNSERAILAKVRHPFLVNLVTTFQDSRNCYMLMDYVIGGEIFSYLRRAGRFSVDVTRFYISTIVLAIEYLHERNIIYRDLKPENLLLDEQGYTKIADFGFAKEVTDRTWTLCGTPEYLAPEIIQSKGHGKAVDWWALGILLFEMLAGYPPFYDNQPFGVYEKILQGNIVFPSHIDEFSRDLIRSLLTADRTRRLGNLRGGAQDVKNHWWFRGVDWDALEKKNIRPPIVPFNTKAGDTSNFSKYEKVRLSSLPGFADTQAPEARGAAVDAHHHLFSSF